MIIDGKKIANEIKAEIKQKVKKLNAEGIYPSLSVVLVGEDNASRIYVRNKQKACEEVGVKSNTNILPSDITTEDLISLIDGLNKNENVHGILIQLPLPKQVDEKRVIEKIAKEKDVDGFTLGTTFTPCTAAGILTLIKSTGETIDGKHAVIVGRSNIVGKPTAELLLKENATITICHSHTKNLSEITKSADILVVATGRKHLIKGSDIKKGSIVIDVGITREDGKLYGDVDFDFAKDIAKYITPVPNGVGPMTIVKLLENTIIAANRIAKKNG